MEESNYSRIYSFERDNWWYRAKRDLISVVLEKLGRRYEKALDLGCGVGSNFEIINKYSNEVLGIDNSSSALNFAKSKSYKKLILMDATKMSFPDNHFDLIICSDVIEHIEDKKAIEEISRVLRPGGILFVSVPAHQYLWGPTDIISKHKKRYELSEIKSLLGKNYSVRKISYWNFSTYLPNLLLTKALRFFGRSKTGKNTLEFTPKILNRLMYLVLLVENRIFHKIDIPQGVSVACVAVKNGK